jgi:hypothetical protein
MEREVELLAWTGSAFPKHIPRSMVPIGRLAIMRRLAEFPAEDAPASMQPQGGGQRPGLQYEPVEFIPPELARMSQVSCGHKERGRDVVELQQRLSIHKIVEVAVVKSDGHRSFWKIAVMMSLDKLLKTERPGMLAQDVEVFGEVSWGDA